MNLMYQMSQTKVPPFALLVTLALCALLSSCANNTLNDTAYEYYLAENTTDPRPPRLIIANRNFGTPSKQYLQKYEGYIDGFVAEHFEDNGFQIVNNQPFEAAWRQATRKYGSPYDASGATINSNAFRRVVTQVFADLKKNGQADAIVFTDLIEQLVAFTGNNNRRAKWHGVSQTPSINGSGQLSASFDWAQTVPASSLRVIIYSLEGDLLFKSIGGLEVTRNLDTQRERFVRKDKLFASSQRVIKGVHIALHPFVPLKQ